MAYTLTVYILFLFVRSAFCAPLPAEIDAILQPQKNRDLTPGIIVYSLDKADVIFERNADVQLIPASVAKIVTSYSALKKLRPTSTFKTTVFAKGPIKDGTLAGDIYLKGGGDPGLVSERMWMLVNDLFRAGIRNISGNIVVDSSYFDLERTPESRPKYLKDQAYNAPVCALSFNFNTTTIYVRPGERVGGPPVIYVDPENPYIDVSNQAKTGKPGSSNSIEATRLDYTKGVLGDTVLIRGSIPAGGKELRYYRNIVNPALYAGHMFKTFLESRGIKTAGNTIEGAVPEDARQLLEFESQPLWHVVWGMNKFSNNFVADQLMKKLGADMWGPPGTLQKGISAVEEVLEDIGIKKGTYKIADGSGLTRETHFSARQLVTILRAAYKDFTISHEFVASLAVAGEDGSLKRRFSSVGPNGKLFLRGKTGSLDGVSALAGYLANADSEMLAFVILLNDSNLKYGSMIDWRDKIAQAIQRFRRESALK